MTEIKEICFKQDTAERKRWFKGLSFAHPAKMHLSLQIYLIEHYTKEGDTILDPMLGSGTLLVACALGRNVIGVELEQKFVDMAKANWEKIKSLGPMLGYTMGETVILQGDARNLKDIFADTIISSPTYGDNPGTPSLGSVNKDNWGKEGKDIVKRRGLIKGYTNNPSNIGNLPYGSIDKIISSPPYAETGVGDWQTGRADFQEWVLNELATKGYVEWQGKRYNEAEWRKLNHGRIDGRTTKGVHKHPTNGYGKTEGQIGNLPYKPDVICTSPPYCDSPTGGGLNTKPPREGHNDQSGRSSSTPSQRGAGKYNKPDVAIFSPPYEAAQEGGGIAKKGYQGTKHSPTDFVGKRSYMPSQHGQTEGQIGNLKADNYLSAMLQVYQGCHKVLKDGGLLVLVVKNFIRNKKIVQLDLDTIKLCKQAGFALKEQLARKLTQQSFWRNIQLDKCDHRQGSKNNPRCKLGLSCPVKKEKQMTIGWKEEKLESQKVLQEVIEKLCSNFINTTPRIEFEDVLIFEKGATLIGG